MVYFRFISQSLTHEIVSIRFSRTKTQRIIPDLFNFAQIIRSDHWTDRLTRNKKRLSEMRSDSRCRKTLIEKMIRIAIKIASTRNNDGIAVSNRRVDGAFLETLRR